MVVRRLTFILLFGLFSSNGFTQISQSCDCIVDTLGLENYLSMLSLNENQPLSFEVENASSTFAVLHGYIDGSTPSVVQSFISNYPNVTTLVFMQVPGSADDNANLIASQDLRNRGYKHYLPAVTAYSQDAFIASGGVDMFVGGLIRVVDVDAEVGVHSWSDGSNDATDFPVGHPYHLSYINYYVNMGFTQQEAEDFYYFTINAAPASGIHFMTETELNNYGTRTCTFASAPNYSLTQMGNTLMADLDNASYQWLDCNNGNSILVGETSQSITLSNNGSYAVIVSEMNCMDTSACFVVDNLSLAEKGTNEITIYPNPTGQVLHIDASHLTNKVNAVEVQNMLGQRMLDVSGNFKEMNVSGLPPGVYILQLQTQEERHSVRFVKE